MKTNRGILFKKMLAVMTVAAIMAAVGLLGLLPAFAQAPPSATRSFDQATVAPREEVVVTIDAANYGDTAAVTETLPDGFSYESSTYGFVTHPVDGNSQMVRFNLLGATSFEYTVTASRAAGSYDFSGMLRDFERNDHAVGGTATVTVRSSGGATDAAVSGVTVTNSPSFPGAAAQYQIKFYTGKQLNEGTGQILLNIDSSVGVPTSLSTQDVRISASLVTGSSTPNQSRPLDLAPVYQVLPGTDNRKRYTISVPDMDAAEARNASIAKHAMVTITLLANSGFTNPTEAGTDDFTVSTSESTTGVKATFTTKVQLFSDDKADNRNKPLTITGKGFKNGTSATVYLDRNKNGMKDTGDVDLISVPVASDDTFEATFNVTVPPFEPGPGNMINAVDGETPPNTAEMGVPFEVEGLLSVSPATLGVGDTLSIDLKDWLNEQITTVEIGGVDHTPLSPPAVANNRLQFDIVIGDTVRLGTQQVKVFTDGENDTTNVLISGADLVITPTTVVPNQTIAVTGRGFHNDASINMGGDDDDSVVSLDGADIKARAGRSSPKVNDGEEVDIDNGGNWSTSIVIPVTGTSITPGPHELKVIDTGGREGVVIVNISERTLTLEPALSRVGTTVTVTGDGFPARNSAGGAEGVQVVQIEYNENGTFRTVSSVTPDSSGSFATTFQVPLNAGIPSTNSVRATFKYTDTGDVRTLTTHSVPEGGITLSTTEATPGDTITVTGQGFKAFRSVNMIEIGNIETTPSPRPSTDTTGSFTTQFLVPGLDLGIKNVSVEVGDTTASASLTIVAAGTTTPMMTPEAEAATPDVAFAAVIAEDNLIAVYHFDPATQNEAPNYGYTVYDARPLFMSGNNLDSIEPGQFYTVEVSEDQMGVTLGSQTVDLYAAFTPIRW